MTLVIADELRIFRDTNGYSRLALAQAMGISVRTLEAWENGRPTALAALVRLALPELARVSLEVEPT